MVVLFWLLVGMIFYTYAGYPLLLALLARWRPRPRFYLPTTPPITLLIAAYNEQALIAKKMDNSLALNYPRDRLQILVAADGSDDRTAEIVRSYADQGVELSYSPVRCGKTAAINRAIRQARGEIVVFSDANNLYKPNALLELVAPFSDPSVGAVTGAKVIVKGDSALGDTEGLYWKYESFIKEMETRLGNCTGVAGEVLAVWRDLFEPPPENIINDDFYIAMRLLQRGYRVVYARHARSVERASLSAQDEIARRARIIAGRYQALALALKGKLLPWHQPLVVWQVVSHKFMRPLVPLAMIGAVSTNLIIVAQSAPADGLLAAFTTPIYWFTLLLQGIFYGWAEVGNYAQGLNRSGRLGKLLYLPTFLMNSNNAALLGLHRFLTHRQTTLWQRVQRAES